MSSQPRKLSRKKKLAFYFVTCLIPVVFISSIYLLYTAYRTEPVYRYVKHKELAFKGKIHKADKELGYVPIPDSCGAQILPIGNDIEACYDNYGFRVPGEDRKSTVPSQHPVVLALGCSFTYGFSTKAEETYPYLVGRDLGGTTRNAGVCGYGLSQMMVLAQRLVPVQRPDYLIVQYSPWLVTRAKSQIGPSTFGKLPTPYFVESQNELSLHPPVFMTKVFDLPIDKYRDTQLGLMDRLSFFGKVGLPLFIHDDFSMLHFTIKQMFGLPEPSPNSQRIEKLVYGEFARVARQNGAKLVIVILGLDHNPVQIPPGIFPDDSIVVDAHKKLLDHLPAVDEEAYAKSYYHLRGSPARIVDTHPNENAHRIIAAAIVHGIRDPLN